MRKGLDARSLLLFEVFGLIFQGDGLLEEGLLLRNVLFKIGLNAQQEQTVFGDIAKARSTLLSAQTPALPTVNIDFQVHYLGPDTIQAKYGRKLPRTISLAEMCACLKASWVPPES